MKVFLCDREWVTGGDHHRRDIGVGDAVFWDQGEMHESGTDSGMTVVVVQALEMNIAASRT